MKLKKLLAKRWLFFVLIIFAFLKLPSLFEPFTYGDEGIYLTLGQAANKGLVWYRDIHDNKPPMLYLIAALANNFTTYRLIHFCWSLITILAFWQLARLVFPKNKPAEIISSTGFTVLTSLHRFEGNVANAENFMLLPTIAAFYFVFETVSQKRQSGRKLDKTPAFLYTAGTLLGLATLFKVPAILDLGAIILFIVLAEAKTKKNIFRTLTLVLYLSMGLISTVVMSIIYYGAKKALPEYLQAAFFQNLPYLSSWGQVNSQNNVLPIGLILRLLLILAVAVILFFYRKRLSLILKLILPWFTFSWFAVLLSSRPYPHYLIQVLPALSLSLGLLWPQTKKTIKSAFVPLGLAIIFQTTFYAFHFWTYPNLKYYQNFYRYAFGLKSHAAYWQEFDPQAESLYSTADYLKKHSLSEEKIFIWGTLPSIYALSQRLPVGRYTTAYHIIDFNGYQETMTALEKKPPGYLITIENETRPFKELALLIKNSYLIEKEFNHIKIYHHQPEL